jgi:FixJ family two-component response regulator
MSRFPEGEPSGQIATAAARKVRKIPNRQAVDAAVGYSVALATASFVSYWLAVHVLSQIARLAPASHTLVLTRTEHNRVVEAIVAGASGYILKTAPSHVIVNAVRATAAGEAVLSSQVAGKLLQRIRERDIPVTASSQAAATAIRAVLTERELEIFTRLASGDSNQQIGHDLVLTPIPSRTTSPASSESCTSTIESRRPSRRCVRDFRSRRLGGSNNKRSRTTSNPPVSQSKRWNVMMAASCRR